MDIKFAADFCKSSLYRPLQVFYGTLFIDQAQKTFLRSLIEGNSHFWRQETVQRTFYRVSTEKSPRPSGITGFPWMEDLLKGFNKHKTYNGSSMNRKPDFLCPLTNLLWKITFYKASVNRLPITAPFGPNFFFLQIFYQKRPFSDIL